MTCETRHIHNSDCLDWLDERGRLRTCHNMILYFMGDFGRAHLWTGAMKLARLAPHLHELDTAVVLVGAAPDGDPDRLSAAATLAEELALPFPLIADTQGILWRRYAAAALSPGGGQAGLVLVDGCGRPLACWPLRAPEQRLDVADLLAVLRELVTA
ncbi:MAG: hypothetical protein R3300_03155 [Candidatus Promineifilaceae bacterium]|nr:hypothetical protein [Candidatus Promineifilaceae bacterium]